MKQSLLIGEDDVLGTTTAKLAARAERIDR